ncbi:hypothetical protein TIFTF001_002194 [Ficus carica]|uniref:Uncharacterized protein n=1 Tax=Ficus carica TaxID=3494 RepID=A0AA88CSU6_FICCA|nr:hypothetical protein TIFTF001_002194 [Ficus carica]
MEDNNKRENDNKKKENDNSDRARTSLPNEIRAIIGGRVVSWSSPLKSQPSAVTQRLLLLPLRLPSSLLHYSIPFLSPSLLLLPLQFPRRPPLPHHPLPPPPPPSFQ